MNILSKLFIFCIAVVGLVSCTDMNSWGDGTRTPSLKASFIYFPQSQIELGGTSNLSKTVQLQAVSTPWKINNPASDWLTVSPTEGNGDATVTFTAKENPTSDNIRVALLSLESTDESYSFNRSLIVNQGQASPILIPNVQYIEFTPEAQTKNVGLSTNTEWTPSCSASWVHLTKLSDTSLDIQVDENNRTVDRMAQINVAGNISSAINIVQHGYEFEDLVSEINFDTQTSTQTLNIQTDGGWNTLTNESWIHVSPLSGKGNTTLFVTVDRNVGAEERTGTISVTVGDVTKYVVVQQKAAYIEILSCSDVIIPASGGTSTITFTTSENWTAECRNTSWVSVSNMNGTAGVNKITLTFSSNNSNWNSRSDTTYIRTNNANLQNLKIISVQAANEAYNGHEYVDLGLPSGVLWATSNIGASSSENYGDYYAWGEIGVKSNYTRDTYEWYSGSGSPYYVTKYCMDILNAVGTVDNKNTLELSDDVAHAKWGGNWRMPTENEMTELCTMCTWNWTIKNQKAGCIVTGCNGNSIFFPAAGYNVDGGVWEEDTVCCYWTSSLRYNKNHYATCMLFRDEDTAPCVHFYSRHEGASVRAVCNKGILLSSGNNKIERIH